MVQRVKPEDRVSLQVWIRLQDLRSCYQQEFRICGTAGFKADINTAQGLDPGILVWSW